MYEFSARIILLRSGLEIYHSELKTELVLAYVPVYYCRVDRLSGGQYVIANHTAVSSLGVWVMTSSDVYEFQL